LLHSLKYRIAASICILELLLLAAILWYTQALSYSSSQDAFRAKAGIIIELLSAASQDALFVEEYAALQSLLEQACETETIQHVYLADARQRVVASCQNDLLGLSSDVMQTWKEAQYYTVRRELKLSEQVVGELSLQFSHAQLAATRAAALALGVKIGGFGMVVIAIFGVLFGHLLTRRLDRVIEHTKKVAGGALHVPLDLPGSDEVSELAVALNEMGRELNRSFKNMAHMAYHDSLTGLVNRVEFTARVTTALKSAKGRNDLHALMYLDLDDFKIVNDTCGHDVGDQLLVKISRTLAVTLRARDTLGRLGGDEFGVLLEHCPLSEAIGVGEKLIEAVSGVSVEWKGRGFKVGISVGVVPISEDSPDLEQLLRDADTACYGAKSRGGGVTYSPAKVSLDTSHASAARWAETLNAAIEEDRWLLYFQEITSLNPRNDAVCWEVLLRLRGEAGISGPDRFLRAAERYKLMNKIDIHVVHMAFERLAMTAEQDRPSITFINLSTQTLGDETFLQALQAATLAFGLAAGSVCFELAEPTLIANSAETSAFFEKLKSMGFLLGIDHFGAGTGSYLQLKQMPLDFIKIGGDIVQNVCVSRVDRMVVSSINDIAHQVGIQTIGTFVESGDVLDALTEIGVDYAQGYAISYPHELKLSAAH
jgi:diguanylate cyclase (GGDEF)-like protein